MHAYKDDRALVIASQGTVVKLEDSWSKRSSNVCSAMRFHTRDRVSIGRRIRDAPSSPCSLAVPDRTSAVVFTQRRFRLASGGRSCGDIAASLLTKTTSWSSKDWFFQSPVTLTLTFFFRFLYLTTTAFTSSSSFTICSLALRGMHLGLLRQFVSLYRKKHISTFASRANYIKNNLLLVMLCKYMVQ